MLVPELLMAVTGLASGLVVTYVGLQNRALLAEVRRELAEFKSRHRRTLLYVAVPARPPLFVQLMAIDCPSGDTVTTFHIPLELCAFPPG